jgi:hypothetical protein
MALRNLITGVAVLCIYAVALPGCSRSRSQFYALGDYERRRQ